MNDAQIKHMADRFLGWRLPEDFSPDCGIHFDADAAKKLNPRNVRYEPNGTNLFDATQAETMVRHMLEGLPSAGSNKVVEDDACGVVFSPEAKRRALELIDPCLELEEVDALRRAYRGNRPETAAEPSAPLSLLDREAADKHCRMLWGERQEDCAKHGADIPMPTVEVAVDELAQLFFDLTLCRRALGKIARIVNSGDHESTRLCDIYDVAILALPPAENSPSDMAAAGGLPPLSAPDDPLNPIPKGET